MKKRTLVYSFIALVAALPIAAFADATPDGAGIYKAKCAMCHGADGAGQTPTGKSLKLKDLRTDEVQKVSDEAIAKQIADGKGKMPAFKAKLSAEEISAVVKFVRSLKK